MQDRELVAAIVAGDQDGLAEAYDRYATPLYAYCRLILSGSQAPGAAASAVADAFIIAAVKLQGLRDPDQLGSWLHAVARNECQRQLGAVGAVAATAWSAGRPPEDAMPALFPPADLREQVLKVCSDTTPAGRAYRVSVAYRAEPFGRTGFPKPIVPAGPRWWQEVRRHPGAVAGVGAVTAAVVAGGIAVLLLTGGPPGARATTLAFGGRGFSTPGAAPGPPGGRSSPSGQPAPASGRPAASADEPTAGRTTSLGTSRSPAPRSASGSPSPSPSPSPSRSPSPSPSPSRSPSPSPSRSPSPSPSPSRSPSPSPSRSPSASRSPSPSPAAIPLLVTMIFASAYPGAPRAGPNQLVLFAVKGKSASRRSS